MTHKRESGFEGKRATIHGSGTHRPSSDGRGEYSEEEYDAALAQIVTAEGAEIEDDFAHARTYTLDEWLQDGS